jgi:hypothetical protein
MISVSKCSNFSSETSRLSKPLAMGNASVGSGVVSLSPDYHRRQATALTHLAETTSDREVAKALLRIASEHIVCADEAERTLALARMKNKGRQVAPDKDWPRLMQRGQD